MSGKFSRIRKNPDQISPSDFQAVGDLSAGDDAKISLMRAAQRAITRLYKTSHNSYNVFFRFYQEFLQKIQGTAGRYGAVSLRTRVIGDGVYTPNSGGVASSSNPSIIEQSGVMYTAGNFEMNHAVGTNNGLGPIAHMVADLTGNGETVFASEYALRNGSFRPLGTISATGNRTLTITSENLAQFGAGVSNRSGIYRGRALLNETLKQTVSATLNNTTRTVTLSAAPANPIQAGDYFGFTADVHNGNCRYLARIGTVTSATVFVLDDTPEGERNAGDAQYQGASTSGEATVFPATIATGYNPDTGVFTFLSPAPDRDSRFIVGHQVVQHPNTDMSLIGHQIDLTRTAPQRKPMDIGFPVINNGTGKAKAAFSGWGNGGFESGAIFRDCDVGVNLEEFPSEASIKAQGMRVIQQNSAPNAWTPNQGDLFLRSGGATIAQIAYVGTGAEWASAQLLSQSGVNVASLPASVPFPGFKIYVIEFGYSLEWRHSGGWCFMGIAATGISSAKPSALKPVGFKFYQTDIGTVVQWNGSAWV